MTPADRLARDDVSVSLDDWFEVEDGWMVDAVPGAGGVRRTRLLQEATMKKLIELVKRAAKAAKAAYRGWMS